MYTTQQTQFGFGGRQLTEAVKKLLIINGAVFLLQFLGGNSIINLFGLFPRLAWSKLYIWQFVSYMFLHGGFLHLGLNMYALWMFGTEVEKMWGTKAFYRYYFITGIGAGLIHTLVTPMSMVPTIGASGAVMGILLAFGMLFPERRITMLLFFVMPVTLKAKHLVMGFAAISILSGMSGSPDGIAHFAHLGGMLIGYIYIKGGLSTIFEKITKLFSDTKRRSNMHVHKDNTAELEKLKRIVDTILDRANEVGFENLTRDEKTVLKKAGKILKKEH